MPDGLLIARGTIALDLFWPAAESDGDTVKVTLAPGDAFSYSPTGDRATLQPTPAFDGAVVKGAQGSFPFDRALAFALERLASSTADKDQLLARVRQYLRSSHGAPWVKPAPEARLAVM